jgi:hypothetical protein
MCSKPDSIHILSACHLTCVLCHQWSCAGISMWHGPRNVPGLLPSILCCTTAGPTVLVTPAIWLHVTLSSRVQGLPHHRGAPLSTSDTCSGWYRTQLWMVWWSLLNIYLWRVFQYRWPAFTTLVTKFSELFLSVVSSNSKCIYLKFFMRFQDY